MKRRQLDIALGHFNNKVEDVKEKKFPLSIKTPLIKYSSVEGFEGMIKDRNFWLTDYKFLWNEEEIAFAKQIIEIAAKNWKWQNEEKDYFLEFLWWLFHGGDKDTNISIYTSSFCRNKDVENMWDEYADKGRGLAIIINENYFKPVKELTDSEYVVTTNMFYNDRLKDCLLEEIFRLSVTLANKTLLPSTQKIKRIIYTALASQLISLMPAIKEQIYDDEDEHRLYRVQLKHNGEIWPSGQKELVIKEKEIIISGNRRKKIFYINSHKFSHDDVLEVQMGPNCTWTKEELENRLRSNGFDLSKLKVTKSILPKA